MTRLKEEATKTIPDDPIIRCMEKTGYPPWMQEPDPYDDEWEEFEGGDVFYGNETSYF